jgi:signal transduction histidine kinase
MHGLKAKTFLLTLLPVLLILSLISGVAIYNKYQSESQLLLDRFDSYRALLESGDLSFDTVQDKTKLESLLGEKVILAEILRSDYSVIYSSENSPAPLITPAEKAEVDDAFKGIETISTERINSQPAFSIVTPLVVNGKVVAVLHQHLSNVESSMRVGQYAAFIISIMLVGLIVCFLLINFLLGKIIIKNIFKLRTAIVEIEKGNLNEKIVVETKDEIGELAASFNQMTARLSGSQRAIDAKIKELSGEHGKLSSLVESVKLGVVMVDLSLKVVLSNSAARGIFGMTPGKELVFKDVSEKIKGKVNISQALSSYVRSGKPLNIQEVMIGDAYYRLFMSPVRDIVQKMFIGAVFVMEDITDQKKLDQMRSEIVSITSHQLRTPATIIKGNLEMVLGGDFGKVNKKQKELLDDTYMGNERMIRLVNDLMDASKIDEGKFVLPTEPTDLEALVAEVVSEVKPFADKKRVALTLEKSAMPLPKAKINRQKVKQVIQNLVDNGIKYTASTGKGRVAVAVKKDGDYLNLSIKDNGIGIPKADQSRIFERFYRGSNSSKLDPGGGSGLGLYIAKGVIEQGGGKIWFDTKENEGTTFFATFPVSD